MLGMNLEPHPNHIDRSIQNGRLDEDLRQRAVGFQRRFPTAENNDAVDDGGSAEYISYNGGR